MTRCGMVCLAVLMAAALVGLILCSLRQGKNTHTQRGSAAGPGAQRAGRPTETGEPVRFRTAEQRLALCRASLELSAAYIEGHGFTTDKTGVKRACRYIRKELAYMLADQAIEAGAIRFEACEDGVMRAELRVLLPEQRSENAASAAGDPQEGGRGERV